MSNARHLLSYRVLVFLAMCVCIAAVARISGDVVLFVVSVGGLAAGHIYMWRTRWAAYRIRTAVLLLLLIVLLFFLGRDMLFAWTNDPLLLARYLVFGLIVTSFDLGTRRNVMGTLVLSGMLMVLLGQMAFDVSFPLLLATFVLLALAAAVRGHVEEETDSAEQVVGRALPASGVLWAGFAGSFALLAVALFLLMPRIGFGALAQSSWLPSRIDLTGRGPSSLPSRPSAGVSPEFLTRAVGGGPGDRYVPLGYTGSAADVPVMHVRSRVVTYWRGSTLNEYDRRGWLPTVSRLTLVDESRNEYAFDDSPRGSPDRRWYAQTYYLLVDQPNAVFTGYNPGRLYLPDSSLVSLHKGTVYRAISRIPHLNPGRLRRDIVERRDIENLELPPISARSVALAESIVAGAPTDYDKAARIEEFLLRNYKYDLDVEPLKPGQDAVDTFLFNSQSGYCSQFATTMAALARWAGLPARVGVGYLPGVYNPMSGAFTVRAGDAHAWVEIHFRNNGWVVFDPTPRPEIGQALGLNQGWVSFGLLDFVGVNFSGAFSTIAGDLSLSLPSVPASVWLIAFVGAFIVGVVAVLLTAARKIRTPDPERYTALDGEARRELLKVYGKMVGLLARKGLPRREASQTSGEYARSVSIRVRAGMDLIGWLTEACDAAAYDTRPFTASVVQEAKDKLALLRRSLALRTG